MRFWDHWETLNAAVGPKRFVIDGVAAVAVGFVAYMASHWSWWPVMPGWLVAILVAVIIIGLWVLSYATELRLRLTPKVALFFQPEKPWVVRHENSNIDEGKAPSVFFRVRVDNIQDGLIAKNVRVAIARIEYRANGVFQNTDFANSQILSWANRAPPERFSPSDVIAGEPRFIEVVSVDPVHNVVHVKWPLKPNWIENQHIFDQCGTYRLTVVATPEGGKTVSIRLLLDWNGNWEETKMKQDTSTV